jgi:type I restriction enzyme, S subunit
MSSEWPLVPIDDIKATRSGSIAIGPFGSRMKSDCYVSEGIRVVRGTNLTGGRSFSGDFVFITSEKAVELNSANLSPNDLVFPHRGSIGEVGLVPNDGERYVLSSSLMKLSCDVDRAHPDFIYYFFKSEAGRFELLKNSSQVGTPGIGQPLTSLRQIKLKLPPLGEQRSIAATLRALDDRIALLRETNATLEAIAQALFKSWFVDFDPVRAKQQGLAPAGMDEVTAALFPDGFEDSEMGPVPKGWHIQPLAALCEAVFSGGTPDTRRSEFWSGDLRWFSSGETRAVVIIDTEKRINALAVQNSSTRLAKPGDVLIASAGQGHTRGQTSHCAIETYINQSVVSVRTDVAKGHAAWTFYNLARRYEEMRTLSDSHSIRGSLTTKMLASMRVLCPLPHLMQSFGGIVAPMLAIQAENGRRAATLSGLRDTLLPRLISGQLRLPEAEALAD